jgi:hypothetical protein
MSERDFEVALAAANPVSREAVVGLTLCPSGREIGGRNLLAAITAEAPAGGAPGELVSPGPAARAIFHRRRFGGRPLALAGAIAAVAAALIAIGTVEGPAGEPEPALGAGLQRLAEVSPPILLAAPGWRVERADEAFASEGSTQFFHGDESLAQMKAEGRAGAGLRQTAELRWLSAPLRTRIGQAEAEGASPVSVATVLGAEARIFSYLPAGRNSLGAIAIWRHQGRVLEFRSYVPDIATFEQRLGALRGVAKGTWLQALPRSVVKTEAGVAVSRDNGWEIVAPRSSPQTDFQPSLYRPETQKESK